MVAPMTRKQRCAMGIADCFNIGKSKPAGTLTDAQLDQAGKWVGTLDSLWRLMFPTVPVKNHALTRHLLTDMRRLRGMKEYTEDDMEKYHQYGRKLEDQQRGSRNRVAAFSSFARFESLENNPDVANQMEIVKLASKRNFKRTFKAQLRRERLKAQKRTPGQLGDKMSRWTILLTKGYMSNKSHS
jgi:hypothetical protein